MTDVNFYDRSSVIDEIYNKTGQNVSDETDAAIEKLGDLGVEPAELGGAEPHLEGAARPSNLIVSVLNKKASIADNFRAGGAVAENFGRRVGDEEEAAKLRPFLSYKGQTEPDAARRLETRSALCLAFGHGATTEDLGKLKASLDANADPMFSRFALAQLNSPGLDFWAFMERLPAPGQNFVEEVDLAHFEATHKNKAVNFVGERGSEYKSEDERSFRSVTAYCGDGYMDIRRRTRRFGPMEP